MRRKPRARGSDPRKYIICNKINAFSGPFAGLRRRFGNGNRTLSHSGNDFHRRESFTLTLDNRGQAHSFKSMEQRCLGKSGIQVGAIGFGAWQLNNPMWGGPDKAASVRLVHAALAAGGNFFDTAPGYGDGASETLLGRALKGHRADVVICTKFGHGGPEGEDFSVAGLRTSLEGSLRRLQTDYADILLLHNPPDELLDGNQAADLYAALESLQQAGKVRDFGASVDFAQD